MTLKHFRMATAGLAASAVIALSACSPAPLHGPSAVTAIEISSGATGSVATLPPHTNWVRTVAVDTEPTVAGEVFVASLAPTAERHELSFVAFDAHRTRWTFATNPTCAGSAITQAADRTPLVVMLNSDAQLKEGKLASRTVATAVDAATGSPRWEHRPALGPISGAGLIFTGAQASIVSAAPHDTATLNPDSGLPAALPAQWNDALVLHEHSGRALLTHDDQLASADLASGDILWAQVTAGEFDRTASSGDILVFRSASASGVEQAHLRHLRTGAKLDSGTGTISTAVNADGTLSAVSFGAAHGSTVMLVDATGPVWKQVLPERSVRVESLGAGRMYLDLGPERAVLDLGSGAVSGRGDFAVPRWISSTDVGLVPISSHQYEVISLD